MVPQTEAEKVGHFRFTLFLIPAGLNPEPLLLVPSAVNFIQKPKNEV